MTLEEMREQILLMQQQVAKIPDVQKYEALILALYRTRTELEKLIFNK